MVGFKLELTGAAQRFPDSNGAERRKQEFRLCRALAAGKWGSGELPSDTEQDLYISELQKKVDKLYNEIYQIKVKP